MQSGLSSPMQSCDAIDNVGSSQAVSTCMTQAGMNGDFAVTYRLAVKQNKQISDQNRSLRHKAFSFTKSVKKSDISKMAKNLDHLNKTTRE